MALATAATAKAWHMQGYGHRRIHIVKKDASLSELINVRGGLAVIAVTAKVICTTGVNAD